MDFGLIFEEKKMFFSLRKRIDKMEGLVVFLGRVSTFVTAKKPKKPTCGSRTIKEIYDAPYIVFFYLHLLLAGRR